MQIWQKAIHLVLPLNVIQAMQIGQMIFGTIEAKNDILWLFFGCYEHRKVLS